MSHPLQGDGETILVRFEVPKELRQLFEGTPTIFSRARFADGSIEGTRLHALAAVEGEDRHGVLELVLRPHRSPPKETRKGDKIELTAGGMVILTCWVAED